MKRLVYNLGLVALLGVGVLVNAQAQGAVGVNTESPNATLEITPTATNALETAETNEGIIIPKLTKARVANINDANLVEGTLVYVSDKTYSGQNAKVAKITDKGFYYYDGNEWVKAGASASAKPFTARLKQKTGANYDWTDGGKGLVDYYEFTTNNGAIMLPNPEEHSGAIIHFKNSTGGNINYTGTEGVDFPFATPNISASSAQIVWSDGTEWHNIGGRR